MQACFYSITDPMDIAQIGIVIRRVDGSFSVTFGHGLKSTSFFYEFKLKLLSDIVTVDVLAMVGKV